MDILGNYWEFFAFIIIFLISGLFALQVWSWITPRNPKMSYGILAGVLVGVTMSYWCYQSYPLVSSILTACMVGVYGWYGYAYVFSLVALVCVFGFNAFTGYRENKPLVLIK